MFPMTTGCDRKNWFVDEPWHECSIWTQYVAENFDFEQIFDWKDKIRFFLSGRWGGGWGAKSMARVRARVYARETTCFLLASYI